MLRPLYVHKNTGIQRAGGWLGIRSDLDVLAPAAFRVPDRPSPSLVFILTNDVAVYLHSNFDYVFSQPSKPLGLISNITCVLNYR